jgi:hypothetical protein
MKLMNKSIEIEQIKTETETTKQTIKQQENNNNSSSTSSVSPAIISSKYNKTETHFNLSSFLQQYDVKRTARMGEQQNQKLTQHNKYKVYFISIICLLIYEFLIENI